MTKKEVIEEIKNNCSIVEIISEYIQVKKIGMSFKAVCPFHSEKTPSLSINDKKNYWHCFGCGEGGDVISFVEKIEKISFVEAVEKLAIKCSINIEKSQNYKEELHTIKLLSNFFKEELQKNSKITSYLSSRGINRESIESFELGYAPDEKSFFKFAKENFLNFDIFDKIGVVGVRQGRDKYFRFAKRIIFPIFSKDNRLIAFGGRALGDRIPKYINSPTSALFDKSKTLYSYNLAKEHIQRQKEAIVVEGYIDAIAMHQMGYKNTVATMGTALSNSNISRLAQQCDTVILAFDSDRAGIEAAKKAALSLATTNQKGYCVFFESGKDAADLLKEGKVELLNDCLNKKEPIINFVAKKMFGLGLDGSVESKNKIFFEMKKFAQDLSPIFKDDFLGHCAHLLKIDKKEFAILKAFETSQRNRAWDLGELTFIKSVLLSDENLTLFGEYIDERIFVHSKDFFEYINENKISSFISKCITDESVPSISDSKLLIGYLKVKIVDYLKRQITSVRGKDIDFENKIILIKQISKIVEQLENSANLSIDDISFFKYFQTESLAG